MRFQVAQWVKNLPAVQETLEIWARFRGQEDPLEEGTATHSSVLAWRIPRTEEPGRLQSKGMQKRHLVTKHAQMWDLSSSTGAKPWPPALEGEALTSGLSGKSLEFEIKKTMPVTGDPPSQTEMLRLTLTKYVQDL